MDGSKNEQGPQGSQDEVKAYVDARLSDLKAHMPETYRSIQAKAAVIGKPAYNFVRRGIAGQPNMFYAVERGMVMGTPFDLPGVSEELARFILQFGCTFLIMWAPGAQQEAPDGAN